MTSKDPSVKAAKTMIKKPRIGQLCVARFSEDELFYPVDIKKINGVQIKVFFIDYENQDTASLENRSLSIYYR